ncbi:hypothetical protein DL93DRAFT_2079006, partial [Clavulina sp. PMI_390]
TDGMEATKEIHQLEELSTTSFTDNAPTIGSQRPPSAASGSRSASPSHTSVIIFALNTSAFLVDRLGSGVQ